MVRLARYDAIVTRFRVGTSGWYYRHWRGDFYPAALDTSDWFNWYAGRFDTVELNNSFYRLPKPQMWELWRREAPDGFVFAVKASRYITHIKRLDVEPASIEKFFTGARLLGPRLGPVLYQLPPSFHRTDENVARLDRFLAQLPPGFTHVFEFRDESWFVEPTFAQLDAHGAAFCSFDMPGIECPLRATGGALYMRFHGAGARYGGDYRESDLRRWSERLRAASRDCGAAYVYFNNDIGGHAPRNAATLQSLLSHGSGRARSNA